MVEDLRDRVADWATESVSDGAAGLARLAEDEFDGVVSGGGVTATLVSGRILHTDGDIETPEGTALTARKAPQPELPLLLAMRATGGEAQAQYYSEETPIDSVDDRLQSGGFTGYLELSENVLSGSYYRLYYGGTARSLAFVGTDDRVLTGADAYDRTLEEVGIYEVVPVELSVTEAPEPPESSNADAESGAVAAPESSNAAASSDTDGGAADADGAGAPAETADQVDTPAAADDRSPGSSNGPVNSSQPAADPGDADATTSSPTAQDVDVAGGPAAAGGDSDACTTVEAQSPPGSGVAAESTPPDAEGATHEESQDEEQPAQADADGASDAGGVPDAGTGDVPDSGTDGVPDSGADAVPDSGADSASEPPAEPTAAGAGTVDGQAIEALEERLESLERRLAALESNDATQETSAGTGERSAGDDCSPTAALQATDFLVRYETRAGATVESLLEGASTADAVRENLRIETNTTLEAATVDGVAFEDSLADSLERRIVGWLLCELPAEIVATDARSALGDLVEALPALDRVGFQETVDLEALGEEPLDAEAPSEVGFDLMAWDTDGQPRLVADLSRSVDPVGEGPVSSLIARARSVASRTDLAAAVFATEGYVEADARRAIEATTGGGILARDSRASYVKMTRKRGFHCCLAEAYDGAIHLTVPEL